ncbi:MAG: MetQ/NlpA family ABC transporter substrate-binding protein, partial [Caldibacillus sp.]
MRKLLLTIIILSFGLIVSACGGGQEKKELVVGATNEPHAVILEEAKPLLEKEGIELEIVTFSSYGMINPALADESLDANYFQHIPYLEAQIEEFGYDFVNAGGIHIEPMG